MSGTHIERLILDVPAMSPANAKRLALLVANGLARSSGLTGTAEIPSMRVVVEGSQNGDLTMLADRIVAGALRQIRRTP
jgi:hypothetical protein